MLGVCVLGWWVGEAALDRGGGGACLIEEGGRWYLWLLGWGSGCGVFLLGNIRRVGWWIALVVVVGCLGAIGGGVECVRRSCRCRLRRVPKSLDWGDLCCSRWLGG